MEKSRLGRTNRDCYSVVNTLNTSIVVVVGGLAILISGVAAAHAVLNKTDVRAAIGWFGLICMVPIVGPLLYGLFGINRIRRRAIVLRPPRQHSYPPRGQATTIASSVSPAFSNQDTHFAPIVALVDAINPSPLTMGNAIIPLTGGDAAFHEMLEAIRGAKKTIGLASYIFDNDVAGRLFCDELAGAVRRGVSVRVLIDGVGARYSYPPITKTQEAGGSL